MPAGFCNVFRSTILTPVPVLHSVVTRQVGGGFGRYQDVVGGHGVFGVRQVDGFHAGAERFHALDRATDAFLHGGVQSFGQVFIGHADAKAFYALLQGCRVIRYRFR